MLRSCSLMGSLVCGVCGYGYAETGDPWMLLWGGVMALCCIALPQEKPFKRVDRYTLTWHTLDHGEAQKEEEEGGGQAEEAYRATKEGHAFAETGIAKKSGGV